VGSNWVENNFLLLSNLIWCWSWEGQDLQKQHYQQLPNLNFVSSKESNIFCFFLSLRTLSIWHQSLLAKEDGTPLEIGKISCQVPKKWWQTNKQLTNKQTDRQTDGKTGRQTNGRTTEKVSDLLKLSQMFCWNYYNTVWI
jgi:hypothetical protein